MASTRSSSSSRGDASHNEKTRRRRIDPMHGFMQHIVAIQKDRHQYEQNWQQKQQQKKKKTQNQPQQQNTSASAAPDVMLVDAPNAHMDAASASTSRKERRVRHGARALYIVPKRREMPASVPASPRTPRRDTNLQVNESKKSTRETRSLSPKSQSTTGLLKLGGNTGDQAGPLRSRSTSDMAETLRNTRNKDNRKATGSKRSQPNRRSGQSEVSPKRQEKEQERPKREQRQKRSQKQSQKQNPRKEQLKKQEELQIQRKQNQQHSSGELSRSMSPSKRKAKREFYVPRQRRKPQEQQEKEQEQPNADLREHIFELRLSDSSQSDHEMVLRVYKGDDPVKVASAFCTEHGIEDLETGILAQIRRNID